MQDALLKPWKATKARKIYSTEIDQVLEKSVSHKLNQTVLDERAREDGERGRTGTIMSMQTSMRWSRTAPPDKQVIAEDEVRWLLRALVFGTGLSAR